MMDKNIDYLVLGCSHYPYLIPVLKKILPEHVQIIDSGQAVAKQTERILNENKLLFEGKKEGKHNLYSNASIEVLQALTEDVPVNRSVSFLDF